MWVKPCFANTFTNCWNIMSLRMPSTSNAWIGAQVIAHTKAMILGNQRLILCPPSKRRRGRRRKKFAIARRGNCEGGERPLRLLPQANADRVDEPGHEVHARIGYEQVQGYRNVNAAMSRALKPACPRRRRAFPAAPPTRIAWATCEVSAPFI